METCMDKARQCCRSMLAERPKVGCEGQRGVEEGRAHTQTERDTLTHRFEAQTHTLEAQSQKGTKANEKDNM